MAVKERILLVEDDAFIREGVTALLVQEGYEVEDCSSLEEARRALEEEEPSLLILDVLLPDGSSFDLCGEIRQRWEAPILFLTCCDQDEDMVRGLDAGGDDYVAKPFRGRVLLSRVRALLRRSRRERGQLRSPWFELDQERQLCRVEGKTLALTPTEYRLLYTLAKAADVVVSRETCCGRCGSWGENSWMKTPWRCISAGCAASWGYTAASWKRCEGKGID